jgi:hypothetical protein
MLKIIMSENTNNYPEQRSVNVQDMEVDLSRIDVDNVDISDIVDKSEIANKEFSEKSVSNESLILVKPVPGSKDSKEPKDVSVSLMEIEEKEDPSENVENNLKDTVGLEDELSEEDILEAKKLAKEVLEETDAYDEDANLDEDAMKKDNQNYAVVSFIGPELTAKSEKYGFRVMGIFPDVDSAQDHCLDMADNAKDGTMYDTGIVELYKFVPSYPTMVEESQEEMDKFLNEIVIKHKTEREEARQMYEMRKGKLMENKGRIKEMEAPKDVPNTVPQGYIKNKDVPQTKSQANDPHSSKTARERLMAKMQKKRDEAARVKELEKQAVKDSKIRLNLKKSDFTVPSQNYMAICFVGHSGSNNRVAMKIKGSYDTYDECETACKSMMDIDDTYDILTAEMYSWLPCDPDVDSIEHVHTDEQLNTLYKSHGEEQKTTIKHHEERKRDTTKALIAGRENNYKEAAYKEEDVKKIMAGISDKLNQDDVEKMMASMTGSTVVEKDTKSGPAIIEITEVMEKDELVGHSVGESGLSATEVFNNLETDHSGSEHKRPWMN